MTGELNLAQMAPDPVLSNIAIQSATGGEFIADQIMPVRKVVNDFGRYSVFGRENIIPDVNLKRAFGAAANRTNISRTYVPFAISSDRSLTIGIPDEVLNNNPNPASVEAQRVSTLMNRIKLDVEQNVKALLDTVPNGAAVGTKWDSASGVTIEKDIDTAKEAFFLQFGVEANAIIIPVPVGRVIKRDPTVRTQIIYTHADVLVNGDLPPMIYNLKVISPAAISKASAAATSVSRVWSSKQVTLLYVDPSRPDEDTNTFGLQIRSPVGAGLDIAAYRWRDPDPTAKTSYVAVALKQIELIVNSNLMYNLTGCIN